MPEVSLDFPREWIEFPDPANADEIFRCDLTWLTSSWHCIFAAGCKGIDETRPNDGCCNHGAYFTEPADEKRTRRYSDMLTPELWENYHEGHRRGIATTLREENEEGVIEKRRRTRIVNGACIYFNSADFPGGMGCALHILAGEIDVHFMETKPEVCWQVPVRRAFDTRRYPDGHEVLVTTITEFDRRAWGEGGHDFDWYCTGAPEAHDARVQVYQSYETELVELMGRPAYNELVKYCVKRNKNPKPNAVHPATKKAQALQRKLLPLTVI